MKIAIANNKIVHNGEQSNKEIIHYGTGTIYTMIATGTAGQTAKVQGSIDGASWVDIVTFTIEADTDVLSQVLQFTYPYLNVTGNAKLQISRG